MAASKRAQARAVCLPSAAGAKGSDSAEIDSRKDVIVARKDRASVLVPRLLKALLNPEPIDRAVFFRKIRPTKWTVYAYSVDPTDVSRIVRESEDGTKVIGRLVGSRFVALKSKPHSGSA